MKDEDYAQSKYLWAHRYGSMSIVFIAAGIYGSRFGLGIAIRGFAGVVLPLAMIWFADDLADWAIRDSGGWISARHADVAVRIAGWLILFFMLLLRGVAYVAAK